MGEWNKPKQTEIHTKPQFKTKEQIAVTSSSCFVESTKWKTLDYTQQSCKTARMQCKETWLCSQWTTVRNVYIHTYKQEVWETLHTTLFPATKLLTNSKSAFKGYAWSLAGHIYIELLNGGKGFPPLQPLVIKWWQRVPPWQSLVIKWWQRVPSLAVTGY